MSNESEVNIERLKPEDIEEYDSVVMSSTTGMLSHTVRFGKVLQSFTETEPFYLVAKINGKIVGVLPSLLKKNEKYGNVLNSLPFFGMHGGPVVPSLNEKEHFQVKKRLLLAFKELAKENHCVFSTLILTPFEPDVDFVRETLKPSFIDSKITQMVVSATCSGNIENQILYKTVEKRCRTAIRKAQKNEIEVEIAQDLKYADKLIEMHKIGMMKKQGVVKPPKFFAILFNELAQNKDFKIFWALKDNQIIAGLLLLYYKNIVEYFTPSFRLEYNDLQPNTLLIYEAMKDSLEHGYNIWNFGGGARLSGVYLFKRSWGAKDYQYYYFINSYGDTSGILNLRQEELMSEYEWFYVLPFRELMRGTTSD